MSLLITDHQDKFVSSFFLSTADLFCGLALWYTCLKFCQRAAILPAPPTLISSSSPSHILLQPVITIPSLSQQRHHSRLYQVRGADWTQRRSCWTDTALRLLSPRGRWSERWRTNYKDCAGNGEQRLHTEDQKFFYRKYKHKQYPHIYCGVEI